jgi:hypothetical protein
MKVVKLLDLMSGCFLKDSVPDGYGMQFLFGL